MSLKNGKEKCIVEVRVEWLPPLEHHCPGDIPLSCRQSLAAIPRGSAGLGRGLGVYSTGAQGKPVCTPAHAQEDRHKSPHLIHSKWRSQYGS